MECLVCLYMCVCGREREREREREKRERVVNKIYHLPYCVLVGGGGGGE